MKIYSRQSNKPSFDKFVGKDLWVLMQKRGFPKGLWVQFESKPSGWDFYIVHEIYNEPHSASRFERELNFTNGLDLTTRVPKVIDVLTTAELRELLVDSEGQPQ